MNNMDFRFPSFGGSPYWPYSVETMPTLPSPQIPIGFIERMPTEPIYNPCNPTSQHHNSSTTSQEDWLKRITFLEDQLLEAKHHANRNKVISEFNKKDDPVHTEKKKNKKKRGVVSAAKRKLESGEENVESTSCVTNDQNWTLNLSASKSDVGSHDDVKLLNMTEGSKSVSDTGNMSLHCHSSQTCVSPSPIIPNSNSMNMTSYDTTPHHLSIENAAGNYTKLDKFQPLEVNKENVSSNSGNHARNRSGNKGQQKVKTVKKNQRRSSAQTEPCYSPSIPHDDLTMRSNFEQYMNIPYTDVWTPFPTNPLLQHQLPLPISPMTPPGGFMPTLPLYGPYYSEPFQQQPPQNFMFELSQQQKCKEKKKSKNIPSTLKRTKTKLEKTINEIFENDLRIKLEEDNEVEKSMKDVVDWKNVNLESKADDYVKWFMQKYFEKDKVPEGESKPSWKLSIWNGSSFRN